MYILTAVQPCSLVKLFQTHLGKQVVERLVLIKGFALAAG